jgi:hypothetical protein
VSATNVYLDIAAVRIQQYLSRSASLRMRRAASSILAEQTSAAVVGPLLALASLGDGTDAVEVKINDEAGVADGVISLVFPAAADDAARDVMITGIEDAVLAHLRDQLPAAEFQAVWGTGTSYVSAYANDLGRKLRDGEVRHDLPAVTDFPLARPCEQCGVGSSARSASVQGVATWLCPDCSVRNVPHNQVTLSKRSPEGRLRSALHAQGGDLDFPAEFDDLALLGSEASGRNHLATVAADGNQFGAFFAALAKAAVSDAGFEQIKRTVSVALADAADEALAIATSAVQPPGAKQICVVPHVVGGDDVVVTLPADLAWQFTCVFLETFETLVAATTVAARGSLKNAGFEVGRLSASAGIVFADARYPFGLALEAADQQMTMAKRSNKGSGAAVRWLDLTADGPEAPERRPVALSLLRDGGRATDTAGALDGLVALPASHRAELRHALRTVDELSAASIASRKGTTAQVRPFLDNPALPLDAALDLVRWWPCS